MTEHHFCLHQGHLDSNAVEDVLRAAGVEAWHANYTEPRGERRGWFACRNLGFPFDRATERAALDAIDAAGGLDAFRVEDPIDDEDIERLRREARAAGDDGAVFACDVALGHEDGDVDEARAGCAQIIREARDRIDEE